MKRDMELIRELMLRLESWPLRRGTVAVITAEDIEIPDYEVEEIDYHLEQIIKAGLIDPGGFKPMSGIGFRALTPAGHDFIDSVRDPEVWSKTKSGASKIGSWSIGLLADMAKAYGKLKAKELLGLDLS